MLRHLATEVGDEWRRLAQCLGIRSIRQQAIIRKTNFLARDFRLIPTHFCHATTLQLRAFARHFRHFGFSFFLFLTPGIFTTWGIKNNKKGF